MAETVASSRGFKTSVAVLAAGITMTASGCSSGGSSNESQPTKAPITDIAPQPKTTYTPELSQADQVTSYIKSAARNKRIQAAVQGFGAQVLESSQNPASVWAPFDTYCSQPKGPFNNDTWTSKGYVPKAGDNCYVQHGPQYGGENTQIGAQVIVGADGKYTDKFIDALISTESCNFVSAHNFDGVWDLSRGTKEPNHYEDSEAAKTIAVAEQIDNFVVNCFNTTTYK